VPGEQDRIAETLAAIIKQLVEYRVLLLRIDAARRDEHREPRGAGVEPEDLIKFGLIPELIGRLPVIATLKELDEAALIQILVEPKNALVKQYQKLFSMEGVELEIRPNALHAVARKAIKRKTGARGLRSILEVALLDIMYDLPTLDNVAKVVVDESTIEDGGKPLLIYAEQQKVSGAN